MSDCRNGGRVVYERHGMYPKQDVREYDMTPAIRFAAMFEDGTERPFTTMGATPGGKRVLKHFELRDEWDNTLSRYTEERECVMTRTFRGYPCNDYTCSECGKTHCAERASEWCPRCGARRTKVVDEEGAEIPFDSALNVEGRAL